MCVASKHCSVGRILYCLVTYLARTVSNVSNVILQIKKKKRNVDNIKRLIFGKLENGGPNFSKFISICMKV